MKLANFLCYSFIISYIYLNLIPLRIHIFIWFLILLYICFFLLIFTHIWVFIFIFFPIILSRLRYHIHIFMLMDSFFSYVSIYDLMFSFFLVCFPVYFIRIWWYIFIFFHTIIHLTFMLLRINMFSQKWAFIKFISGHGLFQEKIFGFCHSRNIFCVFSIHLCIFIRYILMLYIIFKYNNSYCKYLI